MLLHHVILGCVLLGQRVASYRNLLCFLAHAGTLYYYYMHVHCTYIARISRLDTLPHITSPYDYPTTHRDTLSLFPTQHQLTLRMYIYNL